MRECCEFRYRLRLRLQSALRASTGNADAGSVMMVSAHRHCLSKRVGRIRSVEHTSELQSPDHLVCRLLLETKNIATEWAVARCRRRKPTDAFYPAYTATAP